MLGMVHFPTKFSRSESKNLTQNMHARLLSLELNWNYYKLLGGIDEGSKSIRATNNILGFSDMDVEPSPHISS